MELTKQSTDVILFIDKSIIFISDENGQIKKACLEKDRVVISGNIINTASISKILSVSEFYEQYPDKKPVVRKEFNANSFIVKRLENEKAPLEGMIRGLKKYINSNENQGTGNPERMLKKLETKLQNL